jgi:methyl-accepting chemotaxis protein
MLNWLLEYPATDREQRRKGRWLNALMLTLIGIGLALILLQGILQDTQLGQAVPVALGAVVLLLALYALNRQGQGRLAAAGVVVVLTGSVFGVMLTLNTGATLALVEPMFFALVIVTAGVFLSWRWVPLLGVVLSLLTAWYYLGDVSPLLSEVRAQDRAGITLLALIMPAMFAADAALSWLSSRMISDTLADLRERNEELEQAYGTLVMQSRREHELGANIGDLAAQLSSVSARQVSGVAAQANAITQVVSALAELHAAAGQIAAIAQEVRGAADSALVSVQRAQDMVFQSREAVQRNRVQVQEVIKRMERLDQLTGNITQFVNNIRDLSDETHLLALNATIEAAGAGALGRRFGVVAAEVQNLSNRANGVVDQIRGLIGELRQAGEVTLASTQSSIAVADEVESLADEVRQVQEQVVGAVARTNDLVRLISAAASQQSAATAQVSSTMQEIAQVADANRQDTTALERVCQEMTRAAALLNTAITQLRSQITAEETHRPPA